MMTIEKFYEELRAEGKSFNQIMKAWRESPYAQHKEKSVKQKLEDAVLTGVVFDEKSTREFVKANGTSNDNKQVSEYIRQVAFAMKAATIGIQALTEMRN